MILIKRRTREQCPQVTSDAASFEPAARDRAPSGMFGVEVSAPPADLVTSERLKGVRFDLAEPRGYFTEQVETLVSLVTRSLAWHEEALSQRDQGIRDLQAGLETASQREATLRAQVEVFRVQGSVAIDEGGHMLRRSQVTTASDAQAQAKGAAAALDQRLAASAEKVRSLRELAEVVMPQTAQIAELARVAQEQLDVTAQQLVVERQPSTELTAAVASLEAQVASLESQQRELHSLPALAALTGGQSEFHTVLPSTLPRGTSEHPSALPGLKPADPVAGSVAGLLAELLAELVAQRVATSSAGSEAEQSPEHDPKKEAAAGPDIERGREVTRLRDELLRLTTRRTTAFEHAAVLHDHAVLQSTQADAAALLVEETSRSVSRLATVTSQALATTVSRREGLQIARKKDARIAALRAQVHEDAQEARKALVLGQHKFDESSAAQANLERDLHAEKARREAARAEWTAATDAEVCSAADARDAQAAAADCDNLVEEARERLTELANAER